MNFRPLSSKELTLLKRNGCSADDWGKVQVSDRFEAKRMHGVRMAGSVYIGDLSGKIMVGGIERECCIRNSFLCDCIVFGPVYISEVALLAHFEVGPQVVIERALEITVEGPTSFGQGSRIKVINEKGGREIVIFDQLSAPLAYMLAMYRHDGRLIERLQAIVDNHVQSRVRERGFIGSGSVIRNVGTLHNVWIGEKSIIDGAMKIDESTIASTRADPCRLGNGVMLSRCVVLSGARIDGGSILEHCFVGQGVIVDKQFSAEHTAFFANCEAYRGEACGIFAGPFTVTHHRSTLIIAAYLSFFNAGSGTNQSNHLYKLGPLHQGILERGCKTGSSSYLLWPSRVGAFSTVLGKHKVHFNTSDLPFSIIDNEGGKSFVYPSMNLISVGIQRDREKWAARDRRKDTIRIDPIIIELLSPYTVGKILRAICRLKELSAVKKADNDEILLDGIHMHRVVVRLAIKQYEMAVSLFIGNCVAQRIEGFESSTPWPTVAQRLESGTDGVGEWIDAAGLLVPESQVSRLVESIKSVQTYPLDTIFDTFRQWYSQYDHFKWNWCAALIEQQYGKKPHEFSPEELCNLMVAWKDVAKKFDALIELDAAKEFDKIRSTGYGIDGGNNIAKADFYAVRGTLDDDDFIKRLRKDSVKIQQKAESIINMLRRVAA